MLKIVQNHVKCQKINRKTRDYAVQLKKNYDICSCKNEMANKKPFQT